MIKKYDYVIIGAGIAGCSLAYFLKKHSNSVLIIDKNSDVAIGASGAAGAFLSPLLGKDNKFKDLVTKALKFSVDLYKKEFPLYIDTCGTCRIPKNKEDRKKFESYKNFMDFPYEELEDGYFFEIASSVKSYEICKSLVKDVETLFDYEVNTLNENLINNEIKANKLFLTTGADISLIDEEYFNIRAVWGQKINIETSSDISINYHKECSLGRKKDGIVSIGATHHRFEEDMSDTSYNLKLKDLNKTNHNEKTLKIINEDNEKLLKLASDIHTLNDVKIKDIKIGARAASVDYFPLVGKLVDSKKSIEEYPHIINGSFIKDENLIMYEDLYVLNGVGGRGFVLSLYLASSLVNSIVKDEKLEDEITTYRMFKRWVKRLKNRNNK